MVYSSLNQQQVLRKCFSGINSTQRSEEFYRATENFVHIAIRSGVAALSVCQKLILIKRNPTIMLLTNLEERLAYRLEPLGLAYWLEVVTDNPSCLYYFGPFATSAQARQSEPGYLEDLEHEGAHVLVTKVQRCRPKSLTVFQDT
jgi:Domain of unknown function (DUF1816)